MNSFFRFTIIILLFAFVSCRTDTASERQIRSLLSSMSVEQKSSQVLMTGIGGKKVFPQYQYRSFNGVVPGAVLLFKYNIAETPSAVFDYIQSCESAFTSLGSSIPVLFAIDHEGGDVYRTGALTTRLPSEQTVSSRLTVESAQSLYEESGRQLSMLGIKMNLAPVVETSTSENFPFLGSRAFSSSAQTVQQYAKAALLGYRKAGVATVLKHFPGNGSGDPHLDLGTLPVTKAQLESVYVKPFRLLLRSNPDAILVSHIIVPVIEENIPFCLSRPGVTGILRESLGFKGLIITDDISMAAISKNDYTNQEAALLALKAGCDMILISDPDIRSVANAIADEARNNIDFMKRLDDAVTHILRIKCKTGVVKIGTESYSERTNSEFNMNEFNIARTNGDRILEELNDD